MPRFRTGPVRLGRPLYGSSKVYEERWWRSRVLGVGAKLDEEIVVVEGLLLDLPPYVQVQLVASLLGVQVSQKEWCLYNVECITPSQVVCA